MTIKNQLCRYLYCMYTRTRSKCITSISFVVVWLDWIACLLLTGYISYKTRPIMICSSCGHSASVVHHFQIHFNKVFGLEAIICLLTSSPWLIEGQLGSSAHSELCSLLWCMRDIRALASISVVAAPKRGTEPVFCCWSGKYKQWSIVTVSDQLALCLWILRPAEIVCSTPQDVL